MIQGINNIGIAVSQLQKSLEFYTRLGFEIGYQTETSASVRAGSVVLYLFETSSREHLERELSLVHNPLGIDHISLDVPDVDQYYEQLKDKLQFETAPEDQSWGARAATILDPDGNRLYFLSPIRK